MPPKLSQRSICCLWLSLLVSPLLSSRSHHHLVSALNVVLAGGSGPVGKGLASQLSPKHKVTILSRNAFLASAPNRVTEVFGWVGEAYLKQYPHVSIRDWDGGDLLDIVGCDWMGWQDDTLQDADVVVHLVGGFTDQRTMATERLVRESLSVNPSALQVTVGVMDEELDGFPLAKMKKDRLKLCEDMVSSNCANSVCLRLESNRLEQSCEKLKKVIDDLEASQ